MSKKGKAFLLLWLTECHCQGSFRNMEELIKIKLYYVTLQKVIIYDLYSANTPCIALHKHYTLRRRTPAEEAYSFTNQQY